jgi:peptidoglycan/xylan/chitin deacetylase (PgdA/CDA1 family)
VGLHGDQHIDMRGTGLRPQYTALRRGRRDVESVLGRRITWFRAPYGKQDPHTVIACRAAGMYPLMWSTSAHDWQPDDIDSQLSHVEGGLRPGAIVLLHDGAAGLQDPPPPLPNNQPQLLESLLTLLHRLELKPVTVSELCAAGASVRAPWFGSWLHH